MNGAPSRPTPTRSTPRGARPAAVAFETRETAQYMSDIVLELRNLAKHHKLQTLQGLLEVAYCEAFTVATAIEIPEGEIERLRELSKASAK